MNSENWTRSKAMNLSPKLEEKIKRMGRKLPEFSGATR